ncbi:hypothetical protein [Atopomonas sediminilitoris]|uniref:hypothetical protein n=1 Tax=Atopomonas sediminilitoris TaxID=2919919 RepID=UPI001F4D772A|nr:hypothetical protein [Atopomonas sediminilitoris]MCJ8169671.1 hypothetical protein [Atopomonas sediminilitoris]
MKPLLRVSALMLLSVLGFAALGPLLGGLLSLPLLGVRELAALPVWLHYAYLFGVLPAALAGLLNAVLVISFRTRNPAPLWLGLVAGLLAACVFIGPSAEGDDLLHKVVVILLACGGAGWACGVLFNRGLRRVLG